MSKIGNPKDIKYLTFEGGGGLGVAYIGAIRALESKEMGKILPIDLKMPPEKRQIQGISGASAGSITAFLLALGYTSDEMVEYMDAFRILYMEKPEDYRHIFRRVGGEGGEGGIKKIDLNTIHTKTEEKAIMKNLATSMRAGIYRPFLLSKSTLEEALKKLEFSWEQRTHLTDNLDEFIFSLIMNKGFLTAGEVRNLFSRFYALGFKERVKRRLSGIFNENEIPTFKEYYELTKIKLYFTGTNLSHSAPVLFSIDHTPDMKISEAVGISMSFPFLFKPIYSDMVLKANDFVTEDEKRYYRGWFCDGGVINNLPLHAFDYEPDNPPLSSEYPYVRPLHPSVLAFRTIPPQTPMLDEELVIYFSTFLGHLKGALSYGANTGQIRNRYEREQTIDLDTYGLSLINFSPSAKIAAEPVYEAEKATYNYFSKFFKSKGLQPNPDAEWFKRRRAHSKLLPK